MKRNLLSLAAGVGTAGLVAATAIVLMSGAAHAGDWNNGAGSIKDYGTPAVPVPAPVPIPDYAAKWYLRADASFGWLNAPSVAENGMTFGAANAPGSTGPVPFGSQPAWFNRDFDTSAAFGLGAGYYWSSRFRTDLTADVRSHQEVKGAGQYSYTEYAQTNAGYVATNRRTEGSINDKTTVRAGTVLANAYFDLASHMGFTPYVGAGIGVSVNELSRSLGWIEDSCLVTATSNCATRTPRRHDDMFAKTHNASLAWAFMLGASYDLTKSTKLDLNYRYLHVAGTHVDLPINGYNSKVSYGDFGEHQLRAGLRWNID